MRLILTHFRVGYNFPVGVIRDAWVGVVETENLCHCSASEGKRGRKGTCEKTLTDGLQ